MYKEVTKEDIAGKERGMDENTGICVYSHQRDNRIFGYYIIFSPCMLP